MTKKTKVTLATYTIVGIIYANFFPFNLIIIFMLVCAIDVLMNVLFSDDNKSEHHNDKDEDN